MQTTVVKFVTNHRLDSEKGWDLIISRLKKVLKTPNQLYTIEFDIYGDGKMREEVEMLAKQYPGNIRYHGFVSIHTIFQGTMDYDFVMMPSKFLETFGLSALDFAQFGIPTIGYKKGGVAPFVLDDLNISAYAGHTAQEQFDTAMHSILEAYCKHGKSDYSSLVDKDAIKSLYSQGAWMQQFRALVS